MELGPTDHPKNGFEGPHSIMVVYIDHVQHLIAESSQLVEDRNKKLLVQVSLGLGCLGSWGLQFSKYAPRRNINFASDASFVDTAPENTRAL